MSNQFQGQQYGPSATNNSSTSSSQVTQSFSNMSLQSPNNQKFGTPPQASYYQQPQQQPQQQPVYAYPQQQQSYAYPQPQQQPQQPQQPQQQQQSQPQQQQQPYPFPRQQSQAQPQFQSNVLSPSYSQQQQQQQQPQKQQPPQQIQSNMFSSQSSLYQQPQAQQQPQLQSNTFSPQSSSAYQQSPVQQSGLLPSSPYSLTNDNQYNSQVSTNGPQLYRPYGQSSFPTSAPVPPSIPPPVPAPAPAYTSLSESSSGNLNGVPAPQSSPTGTTGKSKQRIDPKQIPRAETEKVGADLIEFCTRCGSIPPPSTSTFKVIDDGNCSPRFVRLTTTQVAADEELTNITKLVVGAVFQPLADVAPGEDPIPVIDTYENGPIRCSRCHAYANPFFRFINQGYDFICNLCQHQNKVPSFYVCNLDGNGIRRDKNERPELCHGSVEYVATREFFSRPIQPPTYIFVIDVSYSSVVTGFMSTVAQSIANCLDAISMIPNAQIGIITFNTSLQFYCIQTSRKKPQMHEVADVDDAFVPVPFANIVVPAADEKARGLFIEALSMIPRFFEKTRIEGCAMGAAIDAASQILQQTGGKILVFQSNLPQVGAGALKMRDDQAMYFTEKEAALFAPQNDFYTTLGTKCAENYTTVDLFVGANTYVDIATVGVLATTTGGQIYFYEGFSASKHGEALQTDLYRDLTRTTGFEAIMVIRASDGLKVNEYFGNFFRRRPHEMELPSIDCDKTFGITLRHDGKLDDKKEACVQCALLYTTTTGQRRIRIHTISVPIASAVVNIYRSADLDAIVSLSLKQACKQILTVVPPDKIREMLTNACIECLHTYRNKCASSTSLSQLILPEPLKLLPQYTLGMIKHPLFHNGQRADERSFLFSYVAMMPTYVSMPFICPRMFSLKSIPPECCVFTPEGRVFLPASLTLSASSLKEDDMYLLDDSRLVYMWIGENVAPEFISEVFDVNPQEQKLHPSELRISTGHQDPQHVSMKINTLLYQLRERRPNFPVFSVIARSKMFGKVLYGETLDETQFRKHLMEDEGGLQSYSQGRKLDNKDPSMLSYMDFLVHIHRKIQEKV